MATRPPRSPVIAVDTDLPLDLADRKEQGGNIYSFELVFGPAKGKETSKPKLIYSDKKQPSYSDAKASPPSDR